MEEVSEFLARSERWQHVFLTKDLLVSIWGLLSVFLAMRKQMSSTKLRVHQPWNYAGTLM